MDRCMLLLCLFVYQVVAAMEDDDLDAILPTVELRENVIYGDTPVAKIRSSWASRMMIEYGLTGISTEKSHEFFYIDTNSGYVFLHKPLDREERSNYSLRGIARDKNGREKEKKIGLRIKVLDENDNPPVFQIMKAGSVKELSAANTVVMRLNATDRDEIGNINSQIAYSILSQSPSDGMFYVTKDGRVCVKSSSLDREAHASYALTVIAQDKNGQAGGNSGSATVNINIEDENDNLPTLEYETYSGEVLENQQNVEVMRFKAMDRDLMYSENWQAVYEIVKGNEAGYFQITTDEKTNEGILRLVKSMNYEDMKSLGLGVLVRNKAALHSSVSNMKFKTYPLKINVKNQIEGPYFFPKTKTFIISEGGSFKINDIIGSYVSIDEDTGKAATNVTYFKSLDRDNWLSIDSKTAEIKLNKLPDRESKYLVNGTYKAEVVCITDGLISGGSRKTVTGTIALQVEDFNDHCPTVTTNTQTICIPADSFVVNAEDKDLSPNGAPFTFEIIPDGTQGKWRLEYLNDTAVILRAQETLYADSRLVKLLVKDAQGKACSEAPDIKVLVCTCEDGKKCGKDGDPTKKTQFGPAGIGLLFLGLLLLLLIPLLLLLCQCGDAGMTFEPYPFKPKQHLISYHTEGKGDNTDMPLINIPTPVRPDPTPINPVPGQYIIPPCEVNEIKMDYVDNYESRVEQERRRENFVDFSRSEMESREVRVRGGLFDGMALPDHILADYYSQKLTSGDENLGVKDGLLVFDYEGQGSPAGSVASLSNLGSDNDLQFLDDLGLQFKTLAGICRGKTIETEVKQVIPPTQTSVSSLMTTQTLPPLPQALPRLPQMLPPLPQTLPPLPQTLPPLPQPLPAIPKAEHTVVRETVEESTVREGMTTVKEGMVNQGQTLLLQQQQPVYYTTTPVMQPMHYVVQPQVQNTMLLAEAPATNLQGMVLVNGTQTMPAQGMVVQGQTVMSTTQAQSPGVVLLQGGGVSSGAQTVMVVEGKGPTGSLKVIKGSPARLVQGGTLPAGSLSGSQRVIVVGGATSSEGQLIQEAGGLSPTISFTDSERVSSTPSYRKVVVQETREIL